MSVAVAPAEVGFSAAEVGLIFGFLFLWAAIGIVDIVRAPIVSLAGAVPLVGSGLASAVDGAIGLVRNWLYSNLSASLVAYSGLLSWLQGAASALWSITGGLADLTVTAVYRITTVIIPAEIALATTHAEALASAAEQQATAYAVGVEQRAGAALGAAESGLVAMVQAASADALSLFQAAEADISSGVAQAEAAAQSLADAERAFTLSAVAVVEADLNARVADVTNLTAAAEAALRGDLGTAVGDLARNLEAGVSALEQEIANARALLLTGTGAIALVAADVAAIKALKCIQQCGVLGSIADDFALLDVAAVLALAQGARADPVGFMGYLTGTLYPAVEGLRQEVNL